MRRGQFGKIGYIYYVSAFILLQLLILLTASDVSAVASSRELRTLTQPDGFTFQARQWGDEYSHGMETEEGYTVVFSDPLQNWTYAVHDDEGNLITPTLYFFSAFRYDISVELN